MRLFGAELLKMRRRTATYVVLGVMLVLTFLFMALVASEREIVRLLFPFPAMWSTVGDFPFGLLGSMLAVAYAAAIAGADWNWGVLRNVIARGESRVAYVLIKALAIALVLAIGVLIVMVAGVLFGVLLTALQGVPLGDPLSSRSLEALGRQLLFGYPVLLERAAIGFAVAIVLRSQVAGIVVGIVLYIGEGVVTALLLIGSMATWIERMMTGGPPPPAQWFQYLPFAVGDQVRAAGAAGTLPDTPFDPSTFLGQVPLVEGLLMLGVYFGLAIGVSVWRAWREEIVA
jgi:hypothetical protein